MQVKDRINYLLNESNLSKRDFAQTLLKLEPKLNSTGKAPSESTIYGYLNIKEQELFEFDIEYSTNYNYKLSLS